jgi:hypothetical protein
MKQGVWRALGEDGSMNASTTWRRGCVLVVLAVAVVAVAAAAGPTRAATLHRPPPAAVAGPHAAVAAARCSALRRRFTALQHKISDAHRTASHALLRRERRSAAARLRRLILLRRAVVVSRRVACRGVPAPGTQPQVGVGGSPTPVLTPTPTVPSTPWPPSDPSVPAAGERSTTDRPDQVAGSLVHLVYVLPADATDRHLDTDGAIAGSFAAAQKWLADVGGVRLRLDTYGGAPDISFHRLAVTDAQAAANGPFVRDLIESSLIGAGFDQPRKILLVYYDGVSTTACGGGAWPPALSGTVGALYLHGAPPGAPACASNPLATAAGTAGYWEHSLVHESFHVMGFVPTCAPHQTLSGHVSDSPKDLMYAGPEPWTPEAIDVGHDDYFRASVPGCPDLADSPYLVAASG